MAKFSDINWKNPGLFAAGVLFGTAGIKALSSKDAKKALHQLHRSSSPGERVCDEDRHHRSGKRN